MFDEDVDRHSRDFQDDDYDRGSVASKQSGNRPAQASTQGAHQWPERGQTAAGVKKVISKIHCKYGCLSDRSGVWLIETCVTYPKDLFSKTFFFFFSGMHH